MKKLKVKKVTHQLGKHPAHYGRRSSDPDAHPSHHYMNRVHGTPGGFTSHYEPESSAQEAAEPMEMEEEEQEAGEE